MSGEEQTEKLNEQLIRLGDALGQGGKEGILLPGRLEQLLQSAEEEQIYLPFLELSGILELDRYEQLLLCLLWHWKRERGGGTSWRRARRLLLPYEGLRRGRKPAPCFWQSQGRVSLSPVAGSFLEMERPQLAPGILFQLPRREKSYGLDRLLLAGRQLIQAQSRPGSRPAALALKGDRGSGRHFAARQLAASREAALITVTGQAVLETGGQLQELLLCCRLYQGMLCVDTGRPGLGELLETLSAYFPFLILIQGKEELLDGDGYDICSWQLGEPDRRLKERILEDILAETKSSLPPGISLEALAVRRLPTGSYIRYVRNLCQGLRLGISPPESGGYAPDSPYLKQMQANRRMEELKLPQTQKEQLERICRIIGASGQVREQWGYGRKYSYGNGISVLFYGAPGTGKTMAAQVMAHTLGLPLLRVDLSQLTSKYIGETQKNIGRIFDEAEHYGCILLFDEADAIFARRSEGTDAQDRYSNGETAYLLQRMEQYGGVSVLATNLFQNFDEAFRRRITYMLHFPMPDEGLREQLWRSVIPQEAEVSTEVDYEALARSFELSGAAIKNASFHAACCAWAEGSPIQMAHLLDGIRNEYGKAGKAFTEEQRQLIEGWM